MAVVYTQLNRLRARLAAEAKAKGYRLASYVSSRAFLWRNVEVGEHCFVFEDNTVQPFVRIGNNVVLWSGNPFSSYAQAEQVYVDGARLYDRRDPSRQPKSDFMLGQDLMRGGVR